MAKTLNQRYGNKVEVKYFDTDKKGLGAYPMVANVVRMGYAFPLVFINGEPRLAGGIDLEQIQNLLDKMSK